MILPKGLELIIERVLLRDDKPRNRLPRVSLRVPHLTHVLYRLVFKVLTELELEQVLGIVRFMEVLEPLAQDVGLMLIRFDRLVVQLLLRLARGCKAELGDVVTESVRSLRVLSCRLEMRVSDLVTILLEVCIITGLEVLVQFRLVAAIFDAKIDDLTSRLRICQVQCWG